MLLGSAGRKQVASYSSSGHLIRTLGPPTGWPCFKLPLIERYDLHVSCQILAVVNMLARHGARIGDLAPSWV